MKPLYYLAVLLLTASTLSAQKINLKKEVVYVDDAATFSFGKKAMGNEIYIYKLNTKDELLNMIVDNNNTESKVDDSKKVVFPKQNVTIKTKDFRGRSYEDMIKLLLEAHVIDLKGEINTENLERFRLKFDESNINHVNKY